MIDWKEKFIKNSGEDLSERNSIREQQRIEFGKYEKELAKELDRLCEFHLDFLRLKKLFERMDYNVEIRDNGVMIEKKIYPEERNSYV